MNPFSPAERAALLPHPRPARPRPPLEAELRETLAGLEAHHKAVTLRLRALRQYIKTTWPPAAKPATR
jgi:hypothetical protein